MACILIFSLVLLQINVVVGIVVMLFVAHTEAFLMRTDQNNTLNAL